MPPEVRPCWSQSPIEDLLDAAGQYRYDTRVPKIDVKTTDECLVELALNVNLENW